MKFKIDVELPSDYDGREPTEEEITDWVCFNVGYTAGLSASNPLVSYDIECDSCFKD